MTRSRARTAGVYLEPTPEETTRVGNLLRDANGNVAFVVDESYIDLGPSRPVLSSSWNAPGDEDATIARLRMTNDKRSRSGVLPPWFTNLLPEGALRRMVAHQMGPGDHDELDMLLRLGRDLPGAVVVRDEGPTRPPAFAAPPDRDPTELSSPLVKFSLAGVQLKLSMVEAGDRLTLPARDALGRVIVKLPVEHYPSLPELEYAAMKLAAAAGVVVAECDLVPVDRIAGVPEKLLRHGERALVVPRFDRLGSKERVHIEDFAQVLGAVGDLKYERGNEETNLKVLSRFVEDGVGAVLEGVRRTVVNILLGNGDAHLKNWSFAYPDGRSAAMTPAYDIVPTIAFGDETMALTFGGSRLPAKVLDHTLERAARYVGMEPRALVLEAKRTVERAGDVWPAMLPGLPLTAATRDVLRHRWDTLALCGDVENAFA